MSLHSQLALVLEWRERAEGLALASEMIAKPLENRAAKLAGRGSDYARLVGIDKDGRVRFTVRGFGQQTFTMEELST